MSKSIREYVVKETNLKNLKGKYVLTRINKYGYINIFWEDIFNTYEEAEKLLKEVYNNRIKDWAIIYINNFFSVRNIIKDENIEKRKYAIFFDDDNLVVFCGVVEAYDKKDLLNKIEWRFWRAKRRMKVLQLQNGKIKGLNLKRFKEMIKDKEVEDNYKNQKHYRINSGLMEMELSHII